MIPWTSSLPEDDLQSFENNTDDGGPPLSTEEEKEATLTAESSQLQTAPPPRKTGSKVGAGLAVLLLVVMGALAGAAVLPAAREKGLLGKIAQPLHPPGELQRVAEAKRREERPGAQVGRKPGERSREESAKAAQKAKAPKPVVTAEERALIQAKLKKMLELSSAAEGLACAIQTQKAEKVADAVEKQVKKAEELSKKPGREDSVEKRLQEALKQLRSLDLMALGRGESLAAAAAKLPQFPTVWDARSDIGQHISPTGMLDHEDTLHRLLIMFNSMSSASVEMRQYFEQTKEAFLSRKRFEGEDDAELLTENTENIYFMDTFIESERKFCALAGKLKDCIYEGLRAKGLKELEDRLLPLQEDFTNTQILLEMAKNKYNAGDEISLETESSLRSAETKVEMAHDLIIALREQVDLVETKSHAEALNAYQAAQEMAEKARALVDDLKAVADAVDGLSGDPESLSKDTLIGMAKHIHDACIIESDAASRFLESVRCRAARGVYVGNQSLTEMFHVLQAEVFDEVLSQMRSIKSKVGTIVSQSWAAFHQSQGAKDSTAALDALKTQAKVLAQLVNAKAEARLLVLDSKLLDLLEEDMDLLQKASNYARVREFPNQSRVAELMEFYDADFENANTAAVEAKTIAGVTRGMVKMRMAMIALYRTITAQSMGLQISDNHGILF
ncbi:hypothetical protein, conserved [Eimeria tenella]|uniref:Uncharacterized protein n=1 Tax=Eimeria tenella TaxID=5802 RepID=U6KUX1_EIMTE|nr:hypothetical protein, conserved [Eimeria tenella]CDJ41766.1 hypothetical protein, conserved [Eimeria tenella]|eukprot:XP_013232516.1 hypothetical protein, conserved [Eimeria tenella]